MEGLFEYFFNGVTGLIVVFISFVLELTTLLLFPFEFLMALLFN